MSLVSVCVFLCFFLSCGKPPTKTHVEYLKRIKVKNSEMAYVDTGGDFDHTVVFLHGNPTSSYLWRNIYPKISSIARCFAPDLIGMGRSDKLPNSTYRFVDHFEYLSAWMEKVVKTKKVNLVIHDWGSALGFHWANMNRDRVESIVHMESIVAVSRFEKLDKETSEFFKAIKTPAGEQLIIKNNLFIESALPSMIIRNLTNEEMNEYRRPYLIPRDRLPTLTWPREIPIQGEGPKDVVDIVVSYKKWLSEDASVKKFLIVAEPGLITPVILDTTKDWPNQMNATVKGLHFLQEDSPEEISDLVYCFLSVQVFENSKMGLMKR